MSDLSTIKKKVRKALDEEGVRIPAGKPDPDTTDQPSMETVEQEIEKLDEEIEKQAEVLVDEMEGETAE